MDKNPHISGDKKRKTHTFGNQKERERKGNAAEGDHMGMWFSKKKNDMNPRVKGWLVKGGGTQ